ncbi:hypothetical protein PybrP1_004823 [[Pythium] brassicae (nom. inval.)]|nr:hypothetical protein PybrP1_004823 [[Pythium] brassicae (nom. inval.)]
MDGVDGALRFLQRQFASVAHEEAQWQEERQRLQQQVRELEAQRSAQEDAYKDALLRVKMLEFALRQERGRYLVSPAPVSTPPAVPRVVEHAPITRPASGSVTISRTMSASHSPPPSPSSAKALGQQVYRVDSGVGSGNGAGKAAPATPKTAAKGTEISRPRMGSRNASSSVSDAPGSNERAEPAKSTKPEKIVLAPKAAFRPHKLKVKLSGHMDGVRALALHPTEPIIVTGSEDCTVKVWNLSTAVSGPPSQRTTELDSLLTIRTQTQSVLSVAIFSAENYPNNGPQRAGAFAAAGRDGSIGLYNLPVAESERGEPFSYEDYQGIKAHTVSRAHDDAVWALHAHPLSNVLFSAGADGVVRAWGVSSGFGGAVMRATELTLKSELRCTTKSHAKATGAIGTALSPVMAITPSFDFHGEQLLQVLRHSDLDALGRDSREAQINQIAVHPTMPVVFAAHQDRKVRMYDMRSAECIGAMMAHQDAVSSISIDAAGLYLATGGHDGSLRIWSVAERHCVFEQSAHRPKMGEAVHAVAFHQSRNFIATGGADCTVKVFQ